jgi:hypothetical protein
MPSSFKEWFLKYILPIGLLVVIVVLLVNHRGILTSEIPIDQGPDPWPLTPEACDVKK